MRSSDSASHSNNPFVRVRPYEQQQKRSGRCPHERANKKSGRRALPIPDHTHQKRCRKYRDTECKIVKAISGAALLGTHEVSHLCLLCSFNESEVDSINQKEDPK